MPYIKPHLRNRLDTPLNELVEIITRNQDAGRAGLINYSIAYLVSQLLAKYRLSYAALNQVIGALECCKLELYRRLAAPYEDQKCEENGDVF